MKRFRPVQSHSQVMCLNLFSGTMCLKVLMLTSPQWTYLPQKPAHCHWLQGRSLEEAGSGDSGHETASPELLLPLRVYRKKHFVCIAAQDGSLKQWRNSAVLLPAQRSRALGLTCPRWRLTAEAAGDMVRNRDLELWGFWNRELVIFHDKMDLQSNRFGRWADEAGWPDGL